VNGVVFFIFFSACSLLVYRKATNSLYIATLLKIFIRSKFSVGIFKVLCIGSLSSTNRDNLNFFFLFVSLLLFSLVKVQFALGFTLARRALYLPLENIPSPSFAFLVFQGGILCLSWARLRP
jgi:hypothetical protein